MKKLSVIISCYAAENIITDCLEALNNQSYTNIEIIVVDANSPDNTVEIISKNFPTVTLIEENHIGVGEALNIGIRNSTGDIIVIDYNTDEVADKNWAIHLVKAHEKTDQYTIISPARLRADGKVGAYGLNIKSNGSVHQIGFGQEFNPKRSAEECEATGINTFKRQLIEDIGYVDEDYYFYGADVDFSTRARHQGYKILTCPKAYTIHSRSVSKSLNHRKYYERMNYGIMRFSLLHLPPSQVLKNIGYYAIFMPILSFGKVWFNLIFNRKLGEEFSAIRGRLDSIWLYLLQFPSNYHKRKQIKE